MKIFQTLLISFLIVLTGCTATAQMDKQTDNTFNSQKAFSPLYYNTQVNQYRNSDGTPGPQYWQNRADYKVKAVLDTSTNIITGKVVISYSNMSPNSLSFVWLQLDQNITKANSRAASSYNPVNLKKDKKGYHLKSVKIFEGGKWQDADYLVSDTRMQIKLQRSLSAKNGILKIAIAYNYLLGAKDPRAGFLETKNGRIYEISYWYPRMCVYDDIRGWDTLPYLGTGEFYLDYGNIDYTVTVPKGMLVVGSGTLLNPAETLSIKQRTRLEKARASDITTLIRTPEEVETEVNESKKAKAKPKLVTWHFKMTNTRDAAWAASAAFVWDAVRINLPHGKKSLAMSVYPVESIGKDSWSSATKYLKNAIEIFSRKWFVYPYPVAINVGAGVGGMEFPGITFDYWKAKSKHLWVLISHEIGHNWFPMVVGSNERRYAWMDEGFNTFIDIYAQEEFNNGQFAPKRDGEYAPKGGNPADEIISVITKSGIPPIMTYADYFENRNDIHPVSYFKTAFGLVLLRQIILGTKRFDYAFKNYIHNWAYKHPSPNDFFRSIENGSGEDLAWFWRGWFLNNWQLDQSVDSVSYVNNDPKQGAIIILENRKRLAMPVLITITETNGKQYDLKLPVEIWRHGSKWSLKLQSTSKIKKIELDAKHQLPDINRDNNVWRNANRQP